MVYCAAYGCSNTQKKGSGLSFFSFPSDAARRKVWTFYCRRKGFVPTNNSRLCSKHFTRCQLERDPDRMLVNGYSNARIRLRSDAVPDVPLLIKPQDENAAIVIPSKKPRGAFVKRQRADIPCLNVLQELEPRNVEDTSTQHCPPDPQPLPETASDPGAETTVPEKETSTINTPIAAVTQSKKCQASIQVPQRTRRIQVSIPMSSSVQTVSTGVQCSSLCDGVSLRVAAGLATLPDLTPQDPYDSDSASDDEEEDSQNPHDPDYDPLDDDISSDEEIEDTQNMPVTCPLRTDVPPEEERQFLVSESCLAQLLQKCSSCDGVCNSVLQFTKGTMIGTLSTCPNGHSSQWESQQCHYGMPWSNILVASAIVFSGSNVSKSLRLFRHLKLTMMSTSTFNRIQTAYVIPASLFTWDFHQEELLRNSEGKILTLGGDARCDSPGFSAKFGSYTLMDLETEKVMDFQLVQSNEVAGSTHMELKGLKRSLRRLGDAGLHVRTLVTDRHGMVKKYMRTEHPDKNHFFDVWHMAKGVSKKLEAAAKKKDCQNIRPWVKSAVNHCYWVAVSSGENGELKEQKWASLTQHIANKHDTCEHGVLAEDKLWLKEGSRAHKLFREVVESKFLLKDIGKLSPLHQTYGLEVYHSVVNSFAPKNTHFFILQ